MFHNLPRDVSGDAEDRRFEQFRNALVPEIVKAESL